MAWINLLNKNNTYVNYLTGCYEIKLRHIMYEYALNSYKVLYKY